MKHPDKRGEGQNDAGETDNIAHVIPLAEEILKVDKKRVEGQTTTIRRVVLQRAATAEVSLESETVVVEMREPVDLNAVGKVLEESVYEARDFTEEPVVSKETKIVQEVVVRRIKNTEIKTINETVRYDEVKVERIGSNASDDDSQGQIAAQG